MFGVSDMDLSILQKSQIIAPLLVRLHDTHSVYKLAADDSPAARLELVQIVSDLVNAELSKREMDLVTDILISLFRQAELDLKQAFAERLALMEQAPERLILQLAYEDIAISESVLRHSNVLQTLDLMYIIQSRDAPYWRAIAGRKAMDEMVIDVLAGVKDVTTQAILAENDNISLSDKAFSRLSHTARDYEDVALPLIRRKDCPKEVARKVYAYVGDALKREIAVSFKLDSAAQKILDDTLSDYNTQIQIFQPSRAMMDAAKSLSEKGLLGFSSLIESLGRGQFRYFVAKFSVFTNIDPNELIDVLSQPKGQGLAVLARSHRLERGQFVKLYLKTRIFRQKSKITPSVDLNHALATFDRLTYVQAEQLLGKKEY